MSEWATKILDIRIFEIPLPLLDQYIPMKYEVWVKRDYFGLFSKWEKLHYFQSIEDIIKFMKRTLALPEPKEIKIDFSELLKEQS